MRQVRKLLVRRFLTTLTIPSQTEVEKLKLAPDEQVLRMERVRYGNDVPICYEIATVPANLVQKI